MAIIVKARRFVAASSQYLTYSARPTSATPLTFACYVRVAAGSIGVDQALVSLFRTSSTWNRLELYFAGATANNPIQARSSTAIASVDGLARDIWIPVVAVFSDSTFRAVYNNTTAGTNTTSSTITISDQVLSIGRTYGGSYANCDIARVCIWTAALTAEEVAQFSDPDTDPTTIQTAKLWAMPNMETLADPYLTGSWTTSASAPTVIESDISNPLTAGTASSSSHDDISVTLSQTVPTGGVPPYAYQWYKDGTAITGATTQNITAYGLAGSTEYDFHCVVTDAVATTSTGNTVTVTADAYAVVPPIATWHLVPNQRINAGETLNAAVIAYTREGVQKVAFSIDSGAAIEVTSETYNPQTRRYEYWTPIAADDYADGAHTLDATITGNGGGTQTLPQYTVYTNANNTRTKYKAWVDATTGNDGAGKIAYNGVITEALAAAAPFASIRGAARAIDALGELSGAKIYVNAGTHTATGPDANEILCDKEWLEIIGLGATNADTVLAATNMFRGTRAKFSNLTVDASVNDMPVQVRNGSSACDLWTVNVIENGPGEVVGYAIGYANGAGSGYIYRTNGEQTNLAAPANGWYYDGEYIHTCYNDPFMLANLVVRCRTADLSTTNPDGVHIDYCQWWGAAAGADVAKFGTPIIVDNRFEGLADQANNHAFFMGDFDAGDHFDGIAFVNNYWDSAIGGTPPRIATVCDQLIFWHNTFNRASMNVYDNAIPKFSCVGNVFGSALTGDNTYAGPDTTGWRWNHFASGTTQSGYSPSTGAIGVDAYGQPTSISALLGKVLVCPVTTDRNGNTRPSEAAIGLYEPEPAIPTDLRATPDGTDTINLAWTDNSSNETGFDIYRSTDGETFTKLATADADATS